MCRGIVGGQGCYKHIMSVDVTCRFVAPMLSISSKLLNFYTKKVGERMINYSISTSTLTFLRCYNVVACICLKGPGEESNAPL